MKKNLLKEKSGFTLIELMVVMAIIAVLAVLIIAAIQAARRASIEAQNTGNAKTIETAMEAYAAANGGTYPIIAAGSGLNSAAVLGVLRPAAGRQYLSSTLNTSCSTNGGGTMTSTSPTFTILVADYNCSTVVPILTITH